MAICGGRLRRRLHRLGRRAAALRHAPVAAGHAGRLRARDRACARAPARASCSTSTTARCSGAYRARPRRAALRRRRRREPRSCRRSCRSCDLIVGTEEEIRIAGGSADTLAALRRLRALTRAPLVRQARADGLRRLRRRDPGDALDDGLAGPGFPVEVFNVLGAGDAFMAGFLRGWLRDEPLAALRACANACGALVVSRHGCAPAMPSWTELQHSSRTARRTRACATTPTRAPAPRRPRGARLARRSPCSPSTTACSSRRSRATPACGRRRRPRAHRALQGAWSPKAPGSAPRRCRRAGRRRHRRRPLRRGRAAGASPAAAAGSRARSSCRARGRWPSRPATSLALALRAWPAEHVAKCLVNHHPDDPAELRRAQMAQLLALQQACIGTDRELLIEVIPPRELPASTPTPWRARSSRSTTPACGPTGGSCRRPPTTAPGGGSIDVHRRAATRYCRGVLLLGMEASEEALARASRSRRRIRAARASPSAARSSPRRRRPGSPGACGDDEVVADRGATLRAPDRPLAACARGGRCRHERTSGEHRMTPGSASSASA